MMNIINMTYQEWKAEGTRLFGEDKMMWRFVCPVCGYVASAIEWIDAGAPSGSIGFSCIGRWRDNPKRAFGDKEVRWNGQCDYAGGGLISLNPVHVESFAYFDFDRSSDVTEERNGI